MNANPSIAFIVPLKQQRTMYCVQCGLLCVNCVSSTTVRATTVLVYTCSNPSLPLMAADPTLPFSPKSAASKCLLWRFDVFGLVPIFHLSWCLGSKRVVLAHRSPVTVWALGSSCTVGHSSQTWGHPAGQLGHDHMTLPWLYGLTLMLPSTALLSGCHSCCRSGRSSLMSGKPCSRPLPSCF